MKAKEYQKRKGENFVLNNELKEDFVIFLEWEEKNEESLIKEDKCSSFNI